MKNVIFLTFASALLMSCGGGGGDNDKDTVASIIGVWEDTVISNNCTKTLTFKEDKTWGLSSLDERQAGTYIVSKEANFNDKFELVLSTITDNGLPDCAGESFDKTGTNQTIYINFEGVTVLNGYGNQTDTETFFRGTKNEE